MSSSICMESELDKNKSEPILFIQNTAAVYYNN